jgi:putative Ca2+/H+ antiporter (TMEM165/GDT1 family)
LFSPTATATTRSAASLKVSNARAASGIEKTVIESLWLPTARGTLPQARALCLERGSWSPKPDKDDDDQARLKAGAAGFWPVAATSFGVIALAELGDLSDITMANLAARYHDPVAVGIGSVLGLWLVAGLAITGGRGLLRILPMRWISRLAALVMVVMAAVTLGEAIR